MLLPAQASDDHVVSDPVKVEINVDLGLKLGLIRLRCPRCGDEVKHSYEDYWYCQGDVDPGDSLYGDTSCGFSEQIRDDDWVKIT